MAENDAKEEYTLQQQWSDVKSRFDAAVRKAMSLMPNEPPYTASPEYIEAIKEMNAARDERRKFEDEIGRMIDTVPGLREKLDNDIEMCTIAMNVAKETLDENCGDVGEIITQISREKENNP